MSAKSGITWTDATWSPVTGCTKVSAGCKNCYAEREVEGRWSKNPKSVFYGRAFTDVRCHPETLEQPLYWKKPRKIFVCPRGDLFHPDVSFEFIDRVFAVMALCPQHTFQVLTKRPERMLKYLSDTQRPLLVVRAAETIGRHIPDSHPGLSGSNWNNTNGEVIAKWPLLNVWLGVSVEDQSTADERIPLLLQTPAAVRWISAEPLLGPVSFRWAKWHDYSSRKPGIVHGHLDGMRSIDWVVCGGESGRSARPMHPDWAKGMRDQCAASGVPFLFKQHGEFLGFLASNEQIEASKSGGWVSLDGAYHDGNDRTAFREGDAHVYRCGTKAAGRLLDGQEWNQYPEVTA